jgi:hypothetical protein
VIADIARHRGIGNCFEISRAGWLNSTFRSVPPETASGAGETRVVCGGRAQCPLTRAGERQWVGWDEYSSARRRAGRSGWFAARSRGRDALRSGASGTGQAIGNQVSSEQIVQRVSFSGTQEWRLHGADGTSLPAAYVVNAPEDSSQKHRDAM